VSLSYAVFEILLCFSVTVDGLGKGDPARISAVYKNLIIIIIIKIIIIIISLFSANHLTVNDNSICK